MGNLKNSLKPGGSRATAINDLAHDLDGFQALFGGIWKATNRGRRVGRISARWKIRFYPGEGEAEFLAWGNYSGEGGDCG
ncbi:MAG: hypothetical protein P8Z00_19945 [Anaerolineales bacterium]